MKRFQVSGHSMLPALEPGDQVVATDSKRPRVGDVVVFLRPEREGFWLIKRLSDPDGWVTSDNQEVGEDDSRTLGRIPIDTMLTVVTRLDKDTFVEAAHLLATEDEALAEAVRRHGLPEFWWRPQSFQVLVLLILEQQVSLESGAAMYKRLAAATGQVTPTTISNLGDEGLRSLGVTRQKSQYLLGLSEAVVAGSLDLDDLGRISVEEARCQLTALKGIGAWTADAYLLSAVRHIDMWPVGDRALQVGAGEVLGMAEPPDEDALEILAEDWRPLRAVAARLIWHAYLSSRGRTEPPDPTSEHARPHTA